MNKITWSRGLFRLWIVISSIWVVLSVLIRSNDVISPYYSGYAILAGENKNTVFDKYSSETYDLDQLVANGKVKKYEAKNIKNTVIYMPTSLSNEDVKLRLYNANTEAINLRDREISKKRWAAIQSAALITILPPIILFIIGYAAIWVFRGFRAT
ncbi:hypothetical protein [Pseudochrobactrum sp. HB0163]|uniref:hypothetical protein n=1 Tax=Pseudochrobactrum sp. HB0163 TaxID=3450708 RepID=UPI003F6DB064